MDRKRGPDAFDVLAGVALLLCGLCLLLIGGGCTTLWVAQLLQTRFSMDGFSLSMLGISVAVAALGVAACYKGVRMMMPRRG